MGIHRYQSVSFETSMCKQRNIKPHDTKLNRYSYLKFRKSLTQSMILIQKFSKSVDVRVFVSGVHKA